MSGISTSHLNHVPWVGPAEREPDSRVVSYAGLPMPRDRSMSLSIAWPWQQSASVPFTVEYCRGSLDVDLHVWALREPDAVQSPIPKCQSVSTGSAAGSYGTRVPRSAELLRVVGALDRGVDALTSVFSCMAEADPRWLVLVGDVHEEGP